MPGETLASLSRMAARAGARALVIDDEASIAAMLCRVLSRAGISVEAAHSGRSALERLVAGEYDVVVCDLRMPDVSGQQLYEQVSASLPHIARRMIFLTGDIGSDASFAFLRSTGCRYIAKPFELRDVIVAVDALLAESEGNEQPMTA